MVQVRESRQGLGSPSAVRPKASARGNGAETKAAIYDASVDLFAEKGYSATSIREIAAVVGIEPASVYNHFSNKEEILYAIILESTEKAIALIEDHVARAGNSPVERLKAATKAHVMFHCISRKTAHIGWADLHCLGPERYKKVAVARDYYEQIFHREIVAGIQTGQLLNTNLTLATNGIIGMGSRAAVWFRPQGLMTDAEVGEYYGDFVVRSLSAG